MRISDWSSDVCSSDLYAADQNAGHRRGLPRAVSGQLPARPVGNVAPVESHPRARRPVVHRAKQPGRLDRKRVVQGKSVSVRVDLGGIRLLTKHTRHDIDIEHLPIVIYTKTVYN